jgi:hypothetical protein
VLVLKDTVEILIIFCFFLLVNMAASDTYHFRDAAEGMTYGGSDILDALEARLDVDDMEACLPPCKDELHATRTKARLCGNKERYLHAYLFALALFCDPTYISDWLVHRLHTLLHPMPKCRGGIRAFISPKSRHCCINPFHYVITNVDELMECIDRVLPVPVKACKRNMINAPALEVCRAMRATLRTAPCPIIGFNLTREFARGAPPAAPL